MPTVHITPESTTLLQELANSLFKAKKVVVVTGAGISTNSGIPVSRRVSPGQPRCQPMEWTCLFANFDIRTFDLKTVFTP